MNDDATPRLGLPFLAAAQAQKEATHNEALQCLDSLVQPVVESADLGAPPVAPTPGACWIVAAAATGAWAGQTAAIAQWTVGGWRFASPARGWRCYVLDRNAFMLHDGIAWQDDVIRQDGLYVSGLRIVGPRMNNIVLPAGGSIIDEQARTGIAAILSVLHGHGLIG